MNTFSFTPAVATLTYERVVEQIEKAITSGSLVPGDHLPSERELMVQFSVSRPTIREALRVLQAMGLVESKPGGRGGPKVLEPSPATLARSFTTMARMDARADVEFHEAVWEASGNALVSLCGQAVSGAIFELITQQLKESSDSERTEADSATLDRGIFEAIAARDSLSAGRLAREAIYNRYRALLPADAVAGLDALRL